MYRMDPDTLLFFDAHRDTLPLLEALEAMLALADFYGPDRYTVEGESLAYAGGFPNIR